MTRFTPVLVLMGLVLLSCSLVRPPSLPPAAMEMKAAAPIPRPAGLPVYDHVVIVVEENKDYEQIIGSPHAPYINRLKAEGANLTRMYAEEHHSQGNYFWLFSGSNQNVGYFDRVPSTPFGASNLGEQLIGSGRSFKGYSEGLPAIGSSVKKFGLYARKHVPWISFSNVPNGTSAATSSNLKFEDFPKTDYSALPKVSFVIPDLVNDMHNGSIASAVSAGDTWLLKNLDGYYQWAKEHNSLLILTFDENDHGPAGLTDPRASEPAKRNRIVTILAGASIQSGCYDEGNGVTHVNLLRTLEAMYGLERSGGQQPFALRAGIADDYILTDVFTPGDHPCAE